MPLIEQTATLINQLVVTLRGGKKRGAAHLERFILGWRFTLHTTDALLRNKHKSRRCIIWLFRIINNPKKSIWTQIKSDKRG